MQIFDSPPYAPMLMESTRAIGYTIEAAVADIIDNSITAQARNINIKFMTVDKPYISILDDGLGMTFDILKDAMNYGSCDPNQERNENDLGRYGLGLKTASLSQCRRLIVVSMANGIISAFCWDLDFIRLQKGKWTLQCFDDNEIIGLPQIEELKKQGTGSLVIWQNLDKVCVGATNIHRIITSKIDAVRNHLELTFHRYLSGATDIKKVVININNKEIKPNDPFLLQKSTILVSETINVKYDAGGEKKTAQVRVTPYILPHLSQMENKEIDRLGGIDGLIKNQGFYVYRNKRLLLYATWFRLARKTDVTKLCRVKVDLPNSLDSEWSLDIKKSACPLYSTGKFYCEYGSFDWRDRMQPYADALSDENLKRYTSAFHNLYFLYESVKNNYAAYIENLQTKLVGYKRRTGVISRKSFIELNRKLPDEDKDDMLEWLDNSENSGLVEKCLCCLDIPVKPVEKITSGQFFEACKAYYQANPDLFNKEKLYRCENKGNKYGTIISPAEATGKDWYYNYADGRDDGLMNIDEDSHEDYLEWRERRGKYEFNGGHPWEIERGWCLSLDAHLQIIDIKESNSIESGQVPEKWGYCFILSWHPLKLPAVVKGFVYMRELGIPVIIHKSNCLKRILKMEDYIGIEKARGDIIYAHGYGWAEKGYGKICDCRFLPNCHILKFIRKIIWKPLEYNKLLKK